MKLSSFLPKQFRPNRQSVPFFSASEGGRAAIEACKLEFQEAARQNLVALLDAKPPEVVIGPAFVRSFAMTEAADPLAGYSLADYRKGELPAAALAAKLMSDPDVMTLIARPSSGIGAETLLTLLLSDALSNGALRHELANRCRDFLCERVLFHPGLPPQPLFSPAALALITYSQPSQLSALPNQGRARLSASIEHLVAGTGALGFWDQWLLRRMTEIPSWLLPDAYRTLPWVAWKPGHPVAATLPDQPDYWSNLLCLEP